MILSPPSPLAVAWAKMEEDAGFGIGTSSVSRSAGSDDGGRAGDGTGASDIDRDIMRHIELPGILSSET